MGGTQNIFHPYVARRDVANLFHATQYAVIAYKGGFIIEVDCLLAFRACCSCAAPRPAWYDGNTPASRPAGSHTGPVRRTVIRGRGKVAENPIRRNNRPGDVRSNNQALVFSMLTRNRNPAVLTESKLLVANQ